MNTKKVNFTKKDLCLLKDFATQAYVKTDCRLSLPGENRSLTEDEHRGLAWIQAVTNLLALKGYDVYIAPRLDEPTSEPDTQGA